MYRQIRHRSLAKQELTSDFTWVAYHESTCFSDKTASEFLKERLNEDRMLAWMVDEKGSIFYAPVRHNLAFTEYASYPLAQDVQTFVPESTVLEMLWIAKWSKNEKSRQFAAMNLKMEIQRITKNPRLRQLLEFTVRELQKLDTEQIGKLNHDE